MARQVTKLKKPVKVFSRNPHFTGNNNAGAYSVHFENGIAEVETQEALDVLVNGFGYYCPELYEEHREPVMELRPDLFGEPSGDSQERAEAEAKAKAEAEAKAKKEAAAKAKAEAKAKGKE